MVIGVVSKGNDLVWRIIRIDISIIITKPNPISLQIIFYQMEFPSKFFNIILVLNTERSVKVYFLWYGTHFIPFVCYYLSFVIKFNNEFNCVLLCQYGIEIINGPFGYVFYFCDIACTWIHFALRTYSYQMSWVPIKFRRVIVIVGLMPILIIWLYYNSKSSFTRFSWVWFFILVFYLTSPYPKYPFNLVI